MKKIVSIILALTMALSLSATVLASSYTDVSDGAQYADAVEYVTEQGLMDAAADGTFAPDDSAPRSIVAEALWRVAGRPQAAKTVVPFCTSGSSPIGASATNLQKSASEAKWLSGSRFSGSASRDSIVSWLNGLDLDITVK